MFDRFFGRGDASASPDTEVVERPAPVPVDPAGDTATVRRIVATLEALPPDQARLMASRGSARSPVNVTRPSRSG